MKTILVLTDFSKVAERAAEFAYEIAIHHQANIHIYNSVIMVERDNPFASKRKLSAERDKRHEKSMLKLDDIAKHLAAKFKEAPAVKITIENGEGDVGETIERLVAENEVWMVVMGNCLDKQEMRQFSDSNIPVVTSYAQCPVVLVP